MRNEHDEQIIEFIEAVSKREHLRGEFRRIFESIDGLSAGLDRDAEQVFLINTRSYLEQIASELDVAEQTVDALLSQARTYRGMLALSVDPIPEDERDSVMTGDTLMPAERADASLSSVRVKAPSFEAPPMGMTVERPISEVSTREVDPFDESPPDRPDRYDDIRERMKQVEMVQWVDEDRARHEENMLFWHCGNEMELP